MPDGITSEPRIQPLFFNKIRRERSLIRPRFKRLGSDPKRPFIAHAFVVDLMRQRITCRRATPPLCDTLARLVSGP